MTTTAHRAGTLARGAGLQEEARDGAGLRELRLRDFRNIPRADLALPRPGLVLIGENGHGKTNFLEAIYYLQLLRSVRGSRDVELARFATTGFHIGARTWSAHSGHGPASISVGFETRGKRKKVSLDGVETSRLSDALGALPSVIVSPRDVELVAGAPSERRRYLDVLLAVTSRSYLTALQRYRAALARRNAALREAARGGNGAMAGRDARIAVWEAPLAEEGATLWLERRAWVEGAAPEFTRLCEAIGERGVARMRFGGRGAHAEETTADALARSLEERRALEVRRGVTLSGPHRDDLELTLDGRELRAFGSAGQQRTAAIALRMLEAATLRERTGAEPVLLLDDPFAELDERRAHRILALLDNGPPRQTILTVPRATDIPEELTQLEHWHIRDGVIGGAPTTPAGA